MNLIKRIGYRVAWKLAQHRGWTVVTSHSGLVNQFFTVGVKTKWDIDLRTREWVVLGAAARVSEEDWMKVRTEDEKRALWITLMRVAELIGCAADVTPWNASFIDGEWFLFRTVEDKVV